jgi:hypothetical protein
MRSKTADRIELARAVHDLEVQVGPVGVAGVPEPPELLAGADALPFLDDDAAGNHVGVEREHAVAYVHDHTVPGRLVDRDARRQLARHLVWQVVHHLDDAARRGGQHIGAVEAPVGEVLKIAFEQAPLLVKLDEVDGEALRRPDGSVQGAGG